MLFNIGFSALRQRLAEPVGRVLAHLLFASRREISELANRKFAMRRRHRKSDCPVHFALEVFGDAWTLLIVRDLMFKGRTSYMDFLRAEEKIATNVLADRLVRLEEDGIVEKASGAGGQYALTKKGIDLLPVMLEIIGWSAKYDPGTAADKAFVRRLHKDRTGLMTEIRSQLADGRTLRGKVSP
jgi:DNA-binding HxlR family transcriptional regulator